jgi:hypothetical protein
MTKALRKLLLVSAAVAFSTPAFAEADAAMPELDVQRSCRDTWSPGLAVEQDFRVCVGDEALAKKLLASKWTSYPAGARARCRAETTIQASPSYVDLTTCLDLDDLAAESSTAGTIVGQ